MKGKFITTNIWMAALSGRKKTKRFEVKETIASTGYYETIRSNELAGTTLFKNIREHYVITYSVNAHCYTCAGYALRLTVEWVLSSVRDCFYSSNYLVLSLQSIYQALKQFPGCRGFYELPT